MAGLGDHRQVRRVGAAIGGPALAFVLIGIGELVGRAGRALVDIAGLGIDLFGGVVRGQRLDVRIVGRRDGVFAVARHAEHGIDALFLPLLRRHRLERTAGLAEIAVAQHFHAVARRTDLFVDLETALHRLAIIFSERAFPAPFLVLRLFGFAPGMGRTGAEHGDRSQGQGCYDWFQHWPAPIPLRLSDRDRPGRIWRSSPAPGPAFHAGPEAAGSTGRTQSNTASAAARTSRP